MDGMMKNQASHWWWLDCHTNTKRSPWLQTTITELNQKTKAMLKLIEQEADSFAQRAEMYYKKRPELVSMVEDFYRTHRLLAERYDQVKPDAGIRLPKPGGSPFASPRYHQPEKLMSFADKGYDSYSECCDVEDSVESDIDDPDPDQEEEEVQFVASNDEVMSLRKEIERLKAHKDQTKQKHEICDEVMVLREEIERLTEENRAQTDEIRQKDIISDEVMMLRKEIEKVRQENRAQKDELRQKDTISDEVMMLRKEIEKVREENRAQKEHLKQKDQEKIEVIRHLSIAIDVLKQENVKMRSFIVKESTKKWKNPFEFNKFIGAITGKLCNGTPKNQPSIVAL